MLTEPNIHYVDCFQFGNDWFKTVWGNNLWARAHVVRIIYNVTYQDFVSLFLTGYPILPIKYIVHTHSSYSLDSHTTSKHSEYQSFNRYNSQLRKNGCTVEHFGNEGRLVV